MTALKNAADLKPEIQEMFESCTCDLHPNQSPFSHLLKQGVYEMVQATHCPVEEHPKLTNYLAK
jgi:hypothetical protein